MRPGDVVEIPGLGSRVVASETVRYDYAADSTRCPACGGMGLPWGGWFSCDNWRTTCGAVALVSTGQVFLPQRGKTPSEVP